MRSPCHALIRAIFVPAGSGGEGRPLHPDAFTMDSDNFMTPVDGQTTGYRWFQMCNFAPGDVRLHAVDRDRSPDLPYASFACCTHPPETS